MIENVCYNRIIYKDKPEHEKKEVNLKGLNSSMEKDGGLSEILISYMNDNNNDNFMQDVKFKEGL